MSWAKLTAIVLLVIVLLTVYHTFEIWAAVFLGTLFALSLNAPAEWIGTKWNIRGWVATLLSMLMVLAVVTGLVFVIGPPIVGQSDQLGRELPAAVNTSLEWMDHRKWGRSIVEEAESISGMSAPEIHGEGKADDERDVQGLDRRSDPLPQKADNNAGQGKDHEEDKAGGSSPDGGGSMMLPILQHLFTMLSVTASTMMLILVSLVITVFVAFNPDVYRRGILWLVPSERESVAKVTLGHISSALRWWVLGRLVSMLMIGLLTSLGMWLVGMPAPLALGALAGILSFVPNIGPIIAAVPGLVLAIPDGPWMLLSALAVYVGAQIIESNLISPLVDQYTVTAPPALLIVVQVIMGLLTGPWGLLIATPLLVVVLVLIQQFYVRDLLAKNIRVIGSSGDKTSDENS